MWTDSPTLMEITNMLPVLKQRAKYNANNRAMLIKVVAPIITYEVVQLLVFECIGEPSIVNGVDETIYVGK